VDLPTWLWIALAAGLLTASWFALRRANVVPSLVPAQTRLSCPLCGRELDSERELEAHLLEHPPAQTITFNP
jgi:hypothetical protein